MTTWFTLYYYKEYHFVLFSFKTLPMQYSFFRELRYSYTVTL